MTFNIHISKANKSLPVDFDSLPEASKRYLIEYGLKQRLNDAGSSATVKELGAAEAGAQAFALAESVLSGLIEGKISIRAKGEHISFEEKLRGELIEGLIKKHLGTPGEGAEPYTEEDLLQKLGISEEKLSTELSRVIAGKVEAREQAKAARLKAKSLGDSLVF